MLPAMEANVPATDMAPDTPGFTFLKVEINIGFVLNKTPISVAQVSAVAEAKATK